MTPPQRLFRLLLRLLPADFRGDFGDEMEAAFAQQHRDTRGRSGRLRLLWTTLRDLVWLPPREHAELFGQDARFALRMLRKHAGVTTVAALSLALGIGANTAMFSVVNRVLLQPLPFRDAERLVRVWETNPRDSDFSISEPNYLDFAERNRSLEQMAAWRSGQWNLTGAAEPERLPGAAVTPSFFTLLAGAPALGRTFTAEEGRPGRDAKLVVLSDGLWRRRFGADPALVGREILLNGESHVVVGVMPKGFGFTSAELWLPLAPSLASNRGDHRLSAAGRLRLGVTLEQARRDFRSVAGELGRQYPDSNARWGTRLASFPDWIIGPAYRRTLLVLLGAVLCVLLIACANVAGLLLARGSARQRELALRAALGASRARLLRQLLTESVLLSGAGGLLGLLLAHWVLAALRGLAALALPRLGEVALDARAFAFTLAVSLISGVLFGIAPALQLSRSRHDQALRDGVRAGVSAARHRLRALLTMSEVALALMLLAGAGLMLRSFAALRAVDPGYRMEGVLLAQVDLPQARYPRASRPAFVDQLIERLRAQPGVVDAAVTNVLPFSGGSTGIGFSVVGRPPATRDESLQSYWRAISPGFFKALGIPLLKGRAFDERDSAEAAPVVIVSQSLAAAVWPDRSDPIGERILAQGAKQPATVVGVVGTMHDVRFQDRSPFTLFLPYPQIQWSGLTLVVRTEGRPMASAPLLRQAVWSVDKELPVSNLVALGDVASLALTQPRFGAQLLAAFAGLALALAAIGVYGILSFGVAQRRQEIGVRIALGARRSDVIGLVAGEAARLVGIGAAFGIAGSLAFSQVMGTLLFGVQPNDKATLLAAALVLAAAAAVASLLPARRASQVDPVLALRSE